MIDRHHARQRLREALPRIVLESFFIVASILLALAVNEWRQRRANETLAQKAVENFRLEITHNKKEVESALPYHRDVASKIATFLEDPENLASLTAELPIVLLNTFAARGVGEPDLRTTSWDTASATNALIHLDYDLIHRLAGTYETQRMGVERTWNAIIQGLLERRSFEQPSARKEAVLFLHQAFTELASQEAALLKSYEKTLSALPMAR